MVLHARVVATPRNHDCGIATRTPLHTLASERSHAAPPAARNVAHAPPAAARHAAGGGARRARSVVRDRRALAARSARGQRADLRAQAGAGDAKGMAAAARLGLPGSGRGAVRGVGLRADPGAAPPRPRNQGGAAEVPALHAPVEEAAPLARPGSNRVQSVVSLARGSFRRTGRPPLDTYRSGPRRFPRWASRSRHPE